MLLLDREQPDAARVALARVYARTGLASDRLALAEALVLDGDPTARLHLTELERTEPRARCWLGMLDLREHREAEGEKALAVCAREVDGDDVPLYELGSLEWERRRFAEARGHFQAAARQSARLYEADLRVGQRRLMSADPLGALNFLRRASFRDRYAAAPREGLVRAYAALGQRAEAQKALDSYLDLVGRNSASGRALTDELARMK
jgi:predicted Zn-dependent protease